MKKTFAEFFAGIGLMRMGLELGGWKIVLANDIDEQKEEMYRANFPDADEHFLSGDIHKLPAREVPTAALATASFPCNNISLVDAREGLAGDRSLAF
jgi:DNA (cytosine-5)-methyltransferase 1